VLVPDGSPVCGTLAAGAVGTDRDALSEHDTAKSAPRPMIAVAIERTIASFTEP
jgi:hypothetical protein